MNFPETFRSIPTYFIPSKEARFVVGNCDQHDIVNPYPEIGRQGTATDIVNTPILTFMGIYDHPDKNKEKVESVKVLNKAKQIAFLNLKGNFSLSEAQKRVQGLVYETTGSVGFLPNEPSLMVCYIHTDKKGKKTAVIGADGTSYNAYLFRKGTTKKIRNNKKEMFSTQVINLYHGDVLLLGNNEFNQYFNTAEISRVFKQSRAPHEAVTNFTQRTEYKFEVYKTLIAGRKGYFDPKTLQEYKLYPGAVSFTFMYC